MSSFQLKFGRLIGIWVQNNKKIEFVLNGLLQLNIVKSEWPKVKTGRMQDMSLKAAISIPFFFMPYLYRKIWMLAF
jgi:hypothetical protein